MSRDSKLRTARVASRCRIECPEMPGADDLTPLNVSLTQRPASVGAGIIHRENTSRRPAYGNRVPPHVEGTYRPLGNLLECGNIDEIGHKDFQGRKGYRRMR